MWTEVTKTKQLTLLAICSLQSRLQYYTDISTIFPLIRRHALVCIGVGAGREHATVWQESSRRMIQARHSRVAHVSAVKALARWQEWIVVSWLVDWVVTKRLTNSPRGVTVTCCTS